MENASKALLMAGGVLIGILILTLAVYLFMSFGAQSEEMHDRMADHQLTEYNAQYTIYDGRNDITIYDIISLANLAYENNQKYMNYNTYEEEYKVKVIFVGRDIADPNSTSTRQEITQDLLNNYSDVTTVANAEGGEDVILESLFKCTNITFNGKGKINSITFQIL